MESETGVRVSGQRVGPAAKKRSLDKFDYDRLGSLKSINDTYGHTVGDQVLAEIARRVMSSLRVYDSAGRYGGEEFLIIVPECNAQQTFASAERLRQTVETSAVSSRSGPIKVTVSIGLISTNGSAQGLDANMYCGWRTKP